MVQGVCVLGDTAVDLIMRLSQFGEGEEVTVQKPHLHPGGSGANTAVALARLRINTQFIGTIGKDQYGQVVVDDFTKENVETDQLFLDPALSTVCVFAFVYLDGERYLWGWPLEKQSFSSIEFKKINLERIRQAGWLHTTGLLLGKESSGRDTTLTILEWCEENGIITSLDLNLRVSKKVFKKSHQDAVMQAIKYSTYILGSDQEFSLLHKSRDWEKAVAMLQGIHKKVIVRRGALGSIFFTEGQCIDSQAYPVKVVDTVGAGDVYNAGFIAAMINYQDAKIALQWGNASAGFSISKEGARTSPTLRQLQKFIGKYQKK